MTRRNLILEAQGVGLGLSTARGLVEALGGNIEIGTHRRWGTRVIFSIVVKEKFCE
jgi:K+-sensing histidine kinase KdpD